MPPSGRGWSLAPALAGALAFGACAIAMCAVATCATAAPVAAQDPAQPASPYVALDDPRLPLLEYLIARGDIADPSPMVRPFRRADAVRALDSATAAGDPAVVASLRASFADPAGTNAWRVAARGGAQGYSHARRDVLHPRGAARVRPYADVAGELIAGNVVLVSRLAQEPRVVDDPEWPGRRDLTLAWRMIEAYGSAQFRYGSLYYGLMDRNWGPVGLPGIGLSDYGYPRTELGVEVGAGGIRVAALASSLRDQRDSLGQVVHRYFFAHRLGVRVTDRLHVALWETTVLSGVDRDFDGRYRNPLSLLLLTNQYGLGADGNVMIGLDARWRVARHATLEAQIALDDLTYENTTGATRYPSRYALTVTGSGALGARLSWRAFYTRATSLAFRTLDPFENFTDAGVGLGRNFDDQDQLTLRVSRPLGVRWLFTPELTLLRQGEGRLDLPFPATDLDAGRTPEIFIGTVERTWRAGLNVSGREGPLDLRADLGLHHVTNAGNEPGRTMNRFEGRFQATLGIAKRGVLP